MNFKSKKELKLFLKKLIFLGFGSQGTCYLNFADNYVYKIFNVFFEEYEEETSDLPKEHILRFSDVKNKTFIWPTDIITINGKIVGYKSPYVRATNLYKIDPLSVNLDTLESAIACVRKDINIISNQGIVVYDTAYNTLFNKKIYVIDQDDYSFSDKDSSHIEKENNQRFDVGIYLFLIDAYFNKFVNDNKELKEMYAYKRVDVIEFIKLLRKLLSELLDKDITHLNEATKYMNLLMKDPTYIREIRKTNLK